MLTKEKATDSNLTGENWEYIIDVCDKVNDDPEDGAKNALAAVQKRLQIPNANTQLFSLTLITSLAQNCGSKMQREIASKSFTSLLLKMADDRSVHHTVKTKIVETMETLSREFKSDPSLRSMEDSYNKLKQKNPKLQPPAKPQKRQMTDLDRQKEEEELQMVLALSLADTPAGSSSSATNNNNSNNYNSGASDALNSQASKPAGTTAATVSRVRALYDLNSSEPGELSFRKDDIITVLESVYRDWWRGSLRGDVGIFPLNYVTPLADPTPEELANEARDEVKVFAESRNIEKLLALLSGADGRDGLSLAENEDLQNLYHNTLSIRPKLVRLIDKYSQKRDDLIQLNEKFINARRTYDELMENSLTQYRAANYGPPHPYAMPGVTRTSTSGPTHRGSSVLPYPVDPVPLGRAFQGQRPQGQQLQGPQGQGPITQQGPIAVQQGYPPDAEQYPPNPTSQVASPQPQYPAQSSQRTQSPFNQRQGSLSPSSIAHQRLHGQGTGQANQPGGPQAPPNYTSNPNPYQAQQQLTQPSQPQLSPTNSYGNINRQPSQFQYPSQPPAENAGYDQPISTGRAPSYSGIPSAPPAPPAPNYSAPNIPSDPPNAAASAPDFGSYYRTAGQGELSG